MQSEGPCAQALDFLAKHIFLWNAGATRRSKRSDLKQLGRLRPEVL